tara:strand:- start:2743 stop:3630 length:888 start_codon:yes stop_codon:yes gene_type:complete
MGKVNSFFRVPSDIFWSLKRSQERLIFTLIMSRLNWGDSHPQDGIMVGNGEGIFSYKFLAMQIPCNKCGEGKFCRNCIMIVRRTLKSLSDLGFITSTLKSRNQLKISVAFCIGEDRRYNESYNESYKRDGMQVVGQQEDTGIAKSSIVTTEVTTEVTYELDSNKLDSNKLQKLKERIEKKGGLYKLEKAQGYDAVEIVAEKFRTEELKMRPKNKRLTESWSKYKIKWMEDLVKVCEKHDLTLLQLGQIHFNVIEDKFWSQQVRSPAAYLKQSKNGESDWIEILLYRYFPEGFKER